MLDRDVVGELLVCELEDMEVPEDVDRQALVEAFCQYTEDDYYEWLKDNFKCFFNQGDPDWEWIREKIKASTVEHK
ncbi:MAG: hypothetical protein FJ008_09165 [Chloroflexi bacterium]|nr:hypothetical protein [Chloroflexota bacterium]